MQENKPIVVADVFAIVLKDMQESLGANPDFDSALLRYSEYVNKALNYTGENTDSARMAVDNGYRTLFVPETREENAHQVQKQAILYANRRDQVFRRTLAELPETLENGLEAVPEILRTLERTFKNLSKRTERNVFASQFFGGDVVQTMHGGILDAFWTKYGIPDFENYHTGEKVASIHGKHPLCEELQHFQQRFFTSVRGRIMEHQELLQAHAANNSSPSR